MIALAAAHAQILALPDQFPKELITMKLIRIHASIVEHVQIHALQAQFQHNPGLHKKRVKLLRYYSYVFHSLFMHGILLFSSCFHSSYRLSDN